MSRSNLLNIFFHVGLLSRRDFQFRKLGLRVHSAQESEILEQGQKFLDRISLIREEKCNGGELTRKNSTATKGTAGQLEREGRPAEGKSLREIYEL